MDVTSQSLLKRLQGDVDDESWQRLIQLYQPLISFWLRRSLSRHEDREDLTQDILAVVVKEMPKFAHPGHPGAFRGWLKAITINRLRSYWRSRQTSSAGSGDTAVRDLVAQLEDPNSAMSKLWDEEHDRHVLQRLLELMNLEFEANTIQAFRRVALDGESAKIVAGDLGMTKGAVYVAKSAVLRRLRQEAEGLID